MKALALLLGDLGYKNVQIYIQSGNVILGATSKPGREIADKIDAAFGFRPDLVVLEEPKFRKVLADNPYTGEGKSIHLYFSRKMPQPDASKLSALISESERYTLKGNVFYLYAPAGIGRSRLVASLEKCLGVRVTGRNLNTANKLLEMTDNL